MTGRGVPEPKHRRVEIILREARPGAIRVALR
jgi:hypothetical protein